MKEDKIIKRFGNLVNFDRNVDILDESCDIKVDDVLVDSTDKNDISVRTKNEYWNDLVELLKTDSSENCNIEDMIKDVLKKYPNNLDEITQNMITEVSKLKNDDKKQYYENVSDLISIEINRLQTQVEQFMSNHRLALEKSKNTELYLEIPPQFNEIKEKLDELSKMKQKYDDYQEQLSIQKDFEFF